MTAIENPRSYKIETDIDGNPLRIKSSLFESILIDTQNSY